MTLFHAEKCRRRASKQSKHEASVGSRLQHPPVPYRPSTFVVVLSGPVLRLICPFLPYTRVYCDITD